MTVAADIVRWLVIVLAALNAGAIIAVWSIYLERRDEPRFWYVTFMALWGLGMIAIASTISLDRLHNTHLSWHSPALAVVFAVGTVGFGLMLAFAKKGYHDQH